MSTSSGKRRRLQRREAVAGHAVARRAAPLRRKAQEPILSDNEGSTDAHSSSEEEVAQASAASDDASDEEMHALKSDDDDDDESVERLVSDDEGSGSDEDSDAGSGPEEGSGSDEGSVADESAVVDPDATYAPEYEGEDEANDADWAEALPHDRDSLRELVERLVEATKKGADARLRHGRTRSEVIEHLCHALSKYYGYKLELVKYFLQLFGSAEVVAFFEANENPRPLTIRCNTLKTRRKDLAQVLIARGCNVDVLGDWTKEGLVVTDSTVPVGATPEYLGGHYMIQSASSFLPVIALQPKPDEYVLDMAAAPGGKSTFISQMMRNSGVLVANDSSKSRSFALAANLHRLGVRNALVVNFDGRKLSSYCQRKFDRVLLDAPCAGSGVFSKDPGAKIKRTIEDFRRLSCLQRELLCQAVDLTNAKSPTGGYIVYSTCSVTVEENEAVIDYILKHRNVKLVDTNIPFGTPGLTHYKAKHFDPSLSLTRRIYPHINNMDGFFVAKLKKCDPPRRQAKPDAEAAAAAADAPAADASAAAAPAAAPAADASAAADATA